MPAAEGTGDGGTQTPRSVAIVGGGIGGLTAAWRLARAGYRVTLMEASDQLGGLGTFFRHDDLWLERFYHCLLPSDAHLLALLNDLGLAARVYWQDSSFGFIRDRRLYPLNGPLELLRFEPLGLLDRLRVGATGAWGTLRPAHGLDNVTCERWLTGLSGRRAFDRFWRPMLEAKFGDRYHEVPALWFWTRFHREKGAKRERKGYVRGGYKTIIDALASGIEAAGGSVELNSPVQRLDLDPTGRLRVDTSHVAHRAFDQLLIAAPPQFLAGATAGTALEPLAARAQSGIDMQGVINGVFLLRRGLTPHYWVATVDEDVPFQGVVESTNLIDAGDLGGLKLVYVMNYVHRSDPRFAAADEAILDDYRAGLRRLFPQLAERDFVARYLFRSGFVEPLYTTGYLARRPPAVLLPGRVYLCTTTQVYPQVTSWNASVGLANATVDALVGGAQPARRRL